MVMNSIRIDNAKIDYVTLRRASHSFSTEEDIRLSNQSL